MTSLNWRPRSLDELENVERYKPHRTFFESLRPQPRGLMGDTSGRNLGFTEVEVLPVRPRISGQVVGQFIQRAFGAAAGKRVPP